VRHLAESHGGKVKAESQPGVGTTISAWIPSADEAADYSDG
jgi:signal transduction histidine kinase